MNVVLVYLCGRENEKSCSSRIKDALLRCEYDLDVISSFLTHSSSRLGIRFVVKLQTFSLKFDVMKSEKLKAC